MPANKKRRVNQVAYRTLKPTIDHRYPSGHFVAINSEEIIADAADFESLAEAIRQRGMQPENVLFVQAGVDYPEEVLIL